MEKERSFWLEKKENGEVIAHVGRFEFLVLEQKEEEFYLLLKGLYRKNETFGKDNDFRGSNVQKICREFADELAAIVGAENLVEHTVDLTSDDGLKDYGSIKERVSLLTADVYRRYVDVLDLNRLDAWWWLATPYSTPRHEDAHWVKCVSPRGYVSHGNYNYVSCGVRPFCILKSNIFVSCKGINHGEKNMDQRKRLIALLCGITCSGADRREGGCSFRQDEQCNRIQALEMCMIEQIADHLLRNSVLTLPCNPGDDVWWLTYKISADSEEEIWYIEKIQAESLYWIFVRRGSFGTYFFRDEDEAKKALLERNKIF